MIPSYIFNKIYHFLGIEDLNKRQYFIMNLNRFTLPYKASRGYYGIVFFFHKLAVVFLKGSMIGMVISGNLLTMLIIFTFLLNALLCQLFIVKSV